MEALDPRNDLARIVIRSVLAFVLLEHALLVACSALQIRDRVTFPDEPFIALSTWSYALGYGLGAGVALAVAEAVLHRAGVVAAVLTGTAASVLAPLGGTFERWLFRSGSSREATEEALAALTGEPVLAWVGFLVGVACLFTPFLVAIGRGAGRSAQVGALAAGAVAWSVLFLALATWAPPRVSSAVLALLLPGACVLLPLCRGAGDGVARRLLGRASGTPRRGRLPAGVAALCASIAAVVVLAPREQAHTAWLRVRAAAGDPRAMRELGLAGRRDLLAPVEHRAWIPCLVNALREASVDERLSTAHGGEELVRIQRELGARWYGEAARRGDVQAMVLLAMHLEEEYEHEGAPGYRDRSVLVEAAAWHRQAATAGHMPAMRALGRRLTQSWTGSVRRVQPDFGRTPAERAALWAEGLAWLRAAAELGDENATSALISVLRGRDNEEALRWARRLAARGEPEGVKQLRKILRKLPELRRPEDEPFLEGGE